ncbi:hypothetical protein RhiirA4_482247 [Rhizophagus irregularis]|uniref:Uncharacterized protein n=1 Tax=Rhizophagus irregularis TaxID=588596 RepID=A0A2I1HKQ3_9GLOM|nr:hypothetical protein RhiirA4_482247 [Rhizophagus irregularis]
MKVIEHFFLGMNVNLNNLLKDFINNLNKRRKIDNDYYIEPMFIEKFLNETGIKIKKESDKESKIFEVISRDNRKSHVIMRNENWEIFNFNIIEGMIINEYNLYWKKKNNFDWTKSFKFISNRNKFSSKQCTAEDTKERAYKIKNLIKGLPTYNTLYERQVNGIENDILCIRCNKETVDWNHVWIDNKIEEIEILNDINIAFIQILKEDSKVLLGYTKTWELIRGVYNNRFNDLSKKKEEQAVMEFLL